MRRVNLTSINASLRKHESLIRAVTLNILSSRPRHHGAEHGLRVSALSEQITSVHRVNTRILPTIRICALVHDIGDSKFRNDTPAWIAALKHTVPLSSLQFVTDVATRVSFSREREMGRADWVQTLGAGIVVRAIVSDADKLDSLGYEGYARLHDYNREKLNHMISTSEHAVVLENEYNILLRDMIWHVITTRQQGLVRYMQTRYGRDRAPELFRELVAHHYAWLRSVNLQQ